MANVLSVLLLVLAFPLVITGAIRYAFIPFAISFEMQRRRDDPGPAGCGPLFLEPPFLSIVVPAYQESAVIDNCLASILKSDHSRFEVVCVDDGSADDTFDRMRRVTEMDPRVRAFRQENAGKGAALNTGIAQARGDVLVLVDADGIFRNDTLNRLLQGFRDSSIGAVCGNDRPVNLNRVQTRMLALISHVGTGLMRRALDALGCLPVVSGNLGAFRREVLEKTGPLRTDTLGEDLELTWRIHRAGFQVAFAPTALVYAESPSTLAGLWRQRVRWARGLLQAISLHWDMVGRARYGTFGLYLAFNTLTQVVLPFLQVASFIVLAALLALRRPETLPETWVGWVLAIGLATSVPLLLLAVALDRAPADLRHLWTVVLWPLYSTAMTFVMIDAVRLELSSAENRWNKLERSGTVSVKGLLEDDDRGS